MRPWPGLRSPPTLLDAPGSVMFLDVHVLIAAVVLHVYTSCESTRQTAAAAAANPQDQQMLREPYYM